MWQGGEEKLSISWDVEYIPGHLYGKLRGFFCGVLLWVFLYHLHSEYGVVLSFALKSCSCISM